MYDDGYGSDYGLGSTIVTIECWHWIQSAEDCGPFVLFYEIYTLDEQTEWNEWMMWTFFIVKFVHSSSISHSTSRPIFIMEKHLVG